MFAVARTATADQDHRTALLSLKELLARTPEHADALFLLGANHAQVGLLAEAEESLGRAVALKPGLESARFELLLLQVLRGASELARENARVLVEGAATPALREAGAGVFEATENSNPAPFPPSAPFLLFPSSPRSPS